MAKMKLITQRKQEYFQSPENSRFCTGAKKTYDDDFKDDGYGFVEWNEAAKDFPVDKIKLLILAPNKQQLKKAVFPDFITELSALEHIVFDLNFLQKESEVAKIPSSVSSMILSRNLAHQDLLKDLLENKVEWREENKLENLKALLIIADKEKEGITAKISRENLPQLKYLGFGFSNKTELDLFERFDALTDLELSNLQDYPIFENIEHLPLASLDITGTNNKFDISGAKNLKTLKFFRLNGVRSEIDCRIFTELPDLTELVVLNSKKILNVEALLECEKLKNISFLDCGSPFKKGIGDKFKAADFEMLDIAYA